MDDRQTEYVGMFVKVKTFLNKKSAELAPTPAIATILQPALIAMIDEIQEEEEDASAPITGSTELKRDLRKGLEEKGFEVAAACAAYYRITVPNPVLRAKCQYERSDLVTTKMKGNDLYVAMKRVHEIAEPIKLLLSPFGVLDTDVDELGAAAAAYFEQLEAPFDARGERLASGKQVDRLIEKTLELIKEKLDVVMKFYITNNPELHDYYLSARRIDETGGGPVPDEDEELTIASGTYAGGAVPPLLTVNSRIVIINRASNTSLVRVGFSNMPGTFSGVSKDVAPGATLNDTALELGYNAGTTYFVYYHPGLDSALSIVIRTKVYY